MQNKYPEQVTAHQWPHHLVAWSTDMPVVTKCIVKPVSAHDETVLLQAFFLHAFKDATENVYSLAKKSSSHKRFKPQKSMPFGKKKKNLTYRASLYCLS